MKVASHAPAGKEDVVISGSEFGVFVRLFEKQVKLLWAMGSAVAIVATAWATVQYRLNELENERIKSTVYRVVNTRNIQRIGERLGIADKMEHVPDGLQE